MPSISLVSQRFVCCVSRDDSISYWEVSIVKATAILVRFNMRDAAVCKRVQQMCGLHIYEQLIYRISGLRTSSPFSYL